MKSHQQSLKRGQPEQENLTKKYTYLSTENTDTAYMQSSHPKILQTISQQAFSDDKGSISNRSESMQNTNRIQKNLSERNIYEQRFPPLKNTNNQSIRSMSQLIENSNHSNIKHGAYDFNHFDKKPPSTHRVNQAYDYDRFQCSQCPFYLNKIAELQNSYELLLMAKNQELDECKIIIRGLEEKLKQIEKRSLQEIEKNKKFRTQMERKTTEGHYHRERENQMIEYLKNRQIVLLEQMKELQNRIYVKEIRSQTNKSDIKQAKSNKKLQFDSKGFNSGSQYGQLNVRRRQQQKNFEFHEDRSLSECSAKTFELQFEMNENAKNENEKLLSSENGKSFGKNQLYSSSGTRMSVELIERVPLNQILKKTNEIQCLRDNLLVSQLKIKIEQTRSLENLLFSQ